MRKLKYEIEDKDYIGIGVSAIVIPILTAIGGFIWWKESLLVIMIIAAILLIILALEALNSRKKYIDANKKYEDIRTHGTRTNGTIIGYKVTKQYLRDSTHDFLYKYSLFVLYNDLNTQKPKTIETPFLNFCPQECLESENCSVYFLDDDFYVTDFEISKNGKGIHLKQIDDTSVMA